MKIIDLIQGTDEWKQHRFQHFNASEAAAMLGLDPKTSRSELLRMKATGAEKEFSSWVQKNILNKGHEVEALARPIVEKLIGEQLYNETGVKEGTKLSASFDGIPMLENIIFEHKQWNEELAYLISQNIVPDTHMPQIQQQFIVADDAEKAIFVVSDGTEENMVWCEVLPDPAWQKRIIDGWDQFQIELDEYEHKEYKEKPVADAIKELPSLFVELSGEVKNTNLPAVQNAAKAFIDNIKTDLKTDEDFSNAEATVKFCDKAEKQLEATKAAALAQTQSIDEVMKTIDFIKEELRSKRLMLNKLVKERKDEIKHEILTEAQDKFSAHVAELNASISPCSIPVIKPDFIGSMKNKRTLKSLNDAVDTTLANAKIEANNVAGLIAENLDFYNKVAADYEFLFKDLNQIIKSPIEAFSAVIQARIGEHKHAEEQRLEKERERIRHEEELKAQQPQSSSQEQQTSQHQLTRHSKPTVNSRHQQSQDQTPFEAWWHDIGSGMSPHEFEEVYDFAKRVAQAAFEHGKQSSLKGAA